ncbi:MAG: translation elongation factor Ts [Candidatus Izemoplasmatales bacterium]
MEINASMVKELRDKTGAGMMDCKKALTATEGDIIKAIDWLREKGIAKAELKAARIASEGLCSIVVTGNKALFLELNCETDFVSRNEKFTNMVEKIGNIIATGNAKCTDCALNLIHDGKTVNQLILEMVANIGEKISLRNVFVVEKNDGQIFGAYKHMGGKIVSLSVMNGGDAETAKDIAMHVCANKPKYLDQTTISKDILDHERSVLTAEALNENATAVKPKPEAIIIKMVEGRLLKNLKEICLVDQPFVKNPDVSVAEYVKSKGATIAAFNRMAVGEGIEKRDDNFAEEVMSQVNK